MEPINRSRLKTNAKNILRKNFWMALLVCLVAGFLGGNWNGLQVGGSIPTLNFSVNDFNSSLMRNENGEPASSKEIKNLLKNIEEEIQSSDVGKDFHFDYDSTIDALDNIKSFYHEVLDDCHITEEDVIRFLLILFGIILLIFIVVWVILSAITFAIGSFVGAPIGVGYRKYFMVNREGAARFDNLFDAFSGGHYMDTVKIMFATNIRIWAWKLLFYFPGLYKYYQYFFVGYIAAENPTLSPERVRELSREMTSGHKWQIFILELSFIGWYLLFGFSVVFLAICSCGLLAIPGSLLIYPIIAYRNATIAELYAERREYILYIKDATLSELPGIAPAQKTNDSTTMVVEPPALPMEEENENKN